MSVPVTILTGFLGSGKTTLLTRLLAHPAMMATAVLVNEIGEIGIDDALIREVSDEVVILTSGCICCSVRNGLVEALQDLHRRCAAGAIPPFERVVVETTGLADPAPIIHTLLLDPSLVGTFRLDGIMTTVDAWFGAGQLTGHVEAARQAVLADRIVLTKTDIAPSDAVAESRHLLARLNPSAPVLCAAEGIAPADVFEIGPSGPGGPAAWLGRTGRNPTAMAADVGLHSGGHLGRYSVFCVEVPQPVVWERFTGWLDIMLTSRSPQILRVKGIVHVAGEQRPMAIHGVQHVFHPPRPLARWPWDDRRTRLVFVTLDLPAEVVSASLIDSLGVG